MPRSSLSDSHTDTRSKPPRALARRSVLIPALAATLLAGCAPVPDLGARPEPLKPAEVAAAQSFAPAGMAQGQWPGDGWWMAYGDPQLDALVAEGLAGSPDIHAAVARLDKAAAMARQTGAARLPQVDVTGGVSETKQSLNMGYPDVFKAFLPQGWNDAGQVAANIGFDLDLWGKNRAAYAAANSEARAAVLDAQQARLVLAAAIASAYIDLDRLFAERDVRARQLEITSASFDLTQQRQRNGLETSGGVATSQAEVANARIALSQADEALALRRNQIAALVGKGPDRGLALTRPALAPSAAPAVPDNATIELVARRADIVAARGRVEAAASRIKVARADFFPAIKLNALFGFQSLGLGLLFDKDSTYGSVGPAISLPVFHGGALNAQYRGARADYDAAVAAYDGVVVQGYQQVADALTTARMASARLADARAAVAGSQKAYDVVNARYKGGLATYLEVLQLEDRLRMAQLSAAGLEAIVRNADIALIRALGGGFADPAAAPDAANSPKDPTHG
ncbi:efflux transporter outer membrane subunit [Novosphingobium flavum]|uniref:Efflux transporter outer membrane subunit n=1 Tax=Novosphingobium flavum TaxID=1778672 RepID=A0A7X1FW20_9SPHN|nr:efflux transporter outer membrane subunit [Novosphingobium flavum]MBC2667432.1 efflux transporter outer membrane subunit [Novosphingobium flavum]